MRQRGAVFWLVLSPPPPLSSVLSLLCRGLRLEGNGNARSGVAAVILPQPLHVIPDRRETPPHVPDPTDAGLRVDVPDRHRGVPDRPTLEVLVDAPVSLLGSLVSEDRSGATLNDTY